MKTMRQLSGFIGSTVWILILTMSAMAWSPPAVMAMLAPPEITEPGSGVDPKRGEDLKKVQRVLEHKMVRQRLQDIGLTSEEINQRLAHASDAQLHELAMQIDALVPGGILDNLLGTILTIALIVLIVVVILILI